MDNNNLVVASVDVVQMNGASGMGAFNSFPQPVYLLDSHMRLVEKNIEGQFAIERHLVGVVADKLHFYNSKSTKYVKSLIDMMMCSADKAAERFILPCVDGVFRAYTLTRHDSLDADFFLTIQDDLVNDERRIAPLARAFSLTPSETRVLSFMVMGNKPKEIAYELNVSLCTVRSHLRTLYAKMNVRNYNDALKEAIRLLV